MASILNSAIPKLRLALVTAFRSLWATSNSTGCVILHDNNGTHYVSCNGERKHTRRVKHNPLIGNTSACPRAEVRLV
jgi:hypothetical protein